MITWTTYGSWLQGDKRGYVKNGKILRDDDSFLQSNLKRLKNPPARLSTEHCKIFRHAIINKAKEINHKIHAIAVCSNHVHIVAERTNQSIEKVVSCYKKPPVLHYDPMVLTEGFGQGDLISASVLPKRNWKVEFNM